MTRPAAPAESRTVVQVESRTVVQAKHRASLLGPWGVVAVMLGVAMGSAITIGTDHASLPRPIGFVAGFLVAALGVGALPSLPTRSVVAVILALGGMVMIRHLQIGSSDGALVLAFLVGGVIALMLSERANAVNSPRLGERVSPWKGAPRSIAMVLAMVLVLATLVAPLVESAMHQDVRTGSSGDPFADSSSRSLLTASKVMDTHSRPRLSDRIVLTVDAQRPAFWRGSTFDRWDGGTWTSSTLDTQPSVLETVTRGSANGDWQRVATDPYDPAATDGVANRQTFTLVAPYANIMYAAPSAAQVLTDRLGFQYSDGSLRVARPLGKGTTYTVESRMPNATAARMRAASNAALPPAFTTTVTNPGVISARVRALALDITRNARTNYDKVQAITEWLGRNTTYSLNAPLPPNDSGDTVDYFLFVSKQGWCEQISSSLTVLSRAVGIPARIATGFATGAADPLTGRFTVRERDAHAWTEVYFAGIGWQGFDPTAAVPLAGEPPVPHSASDWFADHVVVIVIVFGVGALCSLAVWLLLQRVRTLRRRRDASWADLTLAELEKLGATVKRPRRLWETPTQYAAVLAAAFNVPKLRAVGAEIDAAGFGPDPTPAASIQTACETTLAFAGAHKPRIPPSGQI